MTTQIETRLEEIQAKIKWVKAEQGRLATSTAMDLVEEELPWLLEVVGNEREWSEKKSEHILILQPRILELEERVRELEAAGVHKHEGGTRGICLVCGCGDGGRISWCSHE